jgi:hypothetical protein
MKNLEILIHYHPHPFPPPSETVSQWAKRDVIPAKAGIQFEVDGAKFPYLQGSFIHKS